MANEYGWAKQEIDEHIYLDDLIRLSREINRRKIAEYKTQLAIIQNPHVKDPKRLWDILSRFDVSKTPETLDETGFTLLKNKLRQNPRFKIKE